MATTNSVTYVETRGIRGLVASILTRDEAGTLSYGEIFPIAGIQEISKETESNSDTKFYDNIPAIVIDSEGADTITMNVSKVPYDVIGKLTGQFVNTSSGLLVEGNSKRPYVAIGYITSDTDGNDIYVWRHKGKFSLPSESAKTKDNTTDSNGQEIVYTGVATTYKDIVTKENFKACVYKPSADTKELITEAAFFGTIQKPADILTRTAS